LLSLGINKRNFQQQLWCTKSVADALARRLKQQFGTISLTLINFEPLNARCRGPAFKNTQHTNILVVNFLSQTIGDSLECMRGRRVVTGISR
jgi:hypothetical protein